MTSWLSGRVDEAGDLDPGLLVLGGRLLADRVDAAMDVGVVLAVVVRDGIDDDVRLLAARRRVEVDERMPVDLLLEDREVGPDRVRVEAGRAGAVRRRLGGSEVSVIGRSPALAGGLHRLGLELGAGAFGTSSASSGASGAGRPRAGSGRSPRPRGAAPGPCRRS